MTDLTFKASAFFVGGAVMLDFRGPHGGVPTGTMSITRTCTAGVNVGTTDTVASGAAIDPLWLDMGDGIRGSQTVTGPLAPGQYTYDVVAVIDGVTVEATTSALLIAQSITIIPDGMHDVFIRILTGAVRTLTMPAGMNTPEVYNAMPVGGLPPMPFIAVNEELIQQSHVPIGQDVFDASNNNTITIAAYAKRMWRISLFSNSAQERDFIRDYLIAALHVIAKDLFEPLGRNISHRFQAVNYSTAKDGEVPGFFGTDILYDTEGTYNTSLTTSFGSISHIVEVANPE